MNQLNPTRFRILALLSAVALLAPPCRAEDSIAPDADLAKDQATWAKVPTVEQKYQAPPSDWEHAIDPVVGIDMAFPCNWERRVVTQAGITIYIYGCTVGTRLYSVIVQRDDQAGNAKWRDQFFVGNQKGARITHEKQGQTITFTPLRRVNFMAMTGREEKRDFPPRTSAIRMLFAKQTVITLQVIDLAEIPANDLARFFNALRVIN